MATLQTEEALPGGLRFLTLQHAHQVAKSRAQSTEATAFTALAVEGDEAASDPEEEDKSGLKILEDGHQRLYSYFPPRLDGGKQTITVTQEITIDEAKKEKDEKDPKPETKTTTKNFLVQAPQFSLPDGCVNSVNPAPGGLAPAETLPHIVFNDPHLPWERRIDKEEDEARRERTPWLALLVFSQDELQLPNDILQGAESPFSATSLAKDSQGTVKQSPDFALTLSGPDVQALNQQGSIISPIPQPDDPESKTTAIFLQTKLFQNLITTYEQKEKTTEDGKTLMITSPKEDQAAADVSRFKYFAHVRHVKTAGMTTSYQYKDGLFSVILSHRAGPLSVDQKVPAVVHLVSLEGWKDMSLPLPSSAQYVAVSSLHSWSYTALPTGGVSLKAEFEKLKDNIGLLRAPDAVMTKMEAGSNKTLAAKLGKRLKEGYTMQRHRTRTGELTSSFFRAALVPTIPPEPAWSSMSRCGSDLQILDRDTGMMDITYSAAWQLGKSLAIADAAFTTALVRLWNGVYGICLDGAKKDKLSPINAHKSRKQVLQSLKTSLMTLNRIQDPQSQEESHTLDAQRPLAKEGVRLALDDAIIVKKGEERAERLIRRLAGSKDEEGKEYPHGEVLYDELNACVSAEWKMILGWIINRMYLFGVPPAYLIADPTFAPQESIRFFHVDGNWIDALVDGALSLASHMDEHDDYIRRRIKGAINTYLETTNPVTGYRPQIPSYGMILRSDLVTRFPDLKVEAPIPDKAYEAGRAPILRQQIIGDGLLLCLFDRVPGQDDEMPVLSITQPPHQQTFALGDALTPDLLKLSYKRTYTVEKDEYEYAEALIEKTIERQHETPGHPAESGPPPFMWGDQSSCRFILADAWAQDVVSTLRAKMPLDFTDTAMTSSVAGFQLGMPIYRFCIGDSESLKPVKLSLDAKPRPRGLQMLGPMLSGLEEPEPLAMAAAAVLDRPSPLVTLKLESGPPPHFRNTPTPTIKTLDIAQDQHHTAGKAEFAYAAHAIEAPFGPLPVGRGPLDLIFTVKRSDEQLLFKDYWIKRITIRLPRGSKKDETANLLENYHGPGPTMLSNLRFNVLAENTPTSLLIQLQPRSRKARGEGVLISRVEECGFILPLVEALDHERQITMRYIEDWAKPPARIEGEFKVKLRLDHAIPRR
ncbi:hypothetical protein N0V84_009046 [Fusarium piperis]|uniref:Uncharacterized protein n=1 Tax=Fusarium piperis TaxID=1435070 RepID=A0A9W8W722_9HYPO|nr:hypothetical protein N0V84_009046 [Fusarium piperis]